MGFRYSEPWIVPWTTAHEQWIQTGTGVASLGEGTLRFSTSASTLKKRPYSRDYAYTDASVSFPLKNVAGTAGTLRICPLYTSGSVHLGAAITPTTIALLRNGTSSQTIPAEVPVGTVCTVYAHANGAVRVSINGNVVLAGFPGGGPVNSSPAFETVGINTGGLWDLGTVTITPGTIPNPIGTRPLLGHFVIYLLSLGIGESDTQAATHDGYWNPGGSTATLDAYLAASLDRFLPWCDHDARILFRGTHGNHSQGVAIGRSAFAGSPIMVSMFGPRHLDVLAGKNGWTTDPTDARTNDDWQSVWYDRRKSIAQLIAYTSPPPNGYGPSNTPGSCFAWPQNAEAWNFYEQEYNNLGLSVMYDSLSVIDPGGIAGQRPAANDSAIKFYNHVRAARSWIGIEPHSERIGAGTIGHLAYWGAQDAHMASITDRWNNTLAVDTAYFNKFNCPGREHMVLADYTAPNNSAGAMYDFGMRTIDSGSTFAGDPALLSESQVRNLYANGIRMAKEAQDGGAVGRSRTHRR